MEKYVIVRDTVRNIRRFRIEGRTIEFKLKECPQNANPVVWLREAINQILLTSLQDVDRYDQVGISFESVEFRGGAGYLSFRNAMDVRLEDLWELISGIFQSNQEALNTDSFKINVTIVRPPRGSGGKRNQHYNSFEDSCSNRRGILVVKNKDNLCLPRALVLAMAKVEKPNKEYKKVLCDTGKCQLIEAQALMVCANISIPSEGSGIPELKEFQNFLKDKYKITVYEFSLQKRGQNVIFEGESSASKAINLIHYNNHYNVITSLTAAFGYSYFCTDCHRGYNTKDIHKCVKQCQCCMNLPACPEDVKKRCKDCRRWFLGENCFQNHLKAIPDKENKTVCMIKRCCELCMALVFNNKPHTCGIKYCQTCNKKHHVNEFCYISPVTKNTKEKKSLFICYDLETRQDENIDEGIQKHIPNLCVFFQFCEECENKDITCCKKCGLKLQVLPNEKCIEGFSGYILEKRKQFDNVIVIALNGGKFDTHFVLNHFLISKSALKPKLIMSGTKIIKMQIDNIKFLDSYLYFPMALAKLPKAFGLDNKLGKSYFPHLFNRAENQAYIGPIPELKYYSPNSLLAEDRDKLIKWHAEQLKNSVLFNFKEELIKYCINDTLILSKAVQKFRKDILSLTGVDPFLQACTIASTTQKIYMQNFLKPKTIGIVPLGGYRYIQNKQFSSIAVKWLLWEAKTRNLEILHAGNTSERTVGGMKVDGVCMTNDMVFKFFGCFYHGCIKCYKHKRDDPLTQNKTESINSRYESTVARIDHLRSLGHELVIMWECDFRRFLKSNQQAFQFVDKHPVVVKDPIKPRESLFGGRTGNLKEYYRCKSGEKIRYVDIMSLYPFVCKYKSFPIGHPIPIVGDEDCKKMDIFSVNGLIKCKVLPPQNLYHPVLPQRINKRLMFVLCYTCALSSNLEDCDHSEEERCLYGTWTSVEIHKALEKGYKIIEFDEILQYKMETYDPETKTGGLFATMMNTFLKLKQEASGWPADCDTIEKKEKYVHDFFEHEGVLLEWDKIIDNPGLRSIAKLILNSFWGKWAQIINQTNTKIIDNSAEFFDMITSAEYEVHNVVPVNDECVIVNYKFTEESQPNLPMVNVVIAAFVTAHGRLELYNSLDFLGERVLYHDTDSVIYTSSEGQPEIPLGNFLGNFTDELASFGPGSYIDEIALGGPKNYAFSVVTPEKEDKNVVVKVKGFRLDYSASQTVNFDTIKNIILNREEDPLTIHFNSIKRTKLSEVVTVEESKKYRPLSLKRRFFEDFSSEPFGFKRRKYI